LRKNGAVVFSVPFFTPFTRCRN